MMSKLREHLARSLKKKLDRYGIVVWVDEHCEYGPEVARAIVPQDTHFFAWEGSWYALRQAIEPLVAPPEPPRLLIYQGVGTPEEDPLAEVRYAGTEWKIRLATLIREALKGELSTARLEEVARQARTITEAEAALAAGPVIEVRLQAALEATDPIELGLRLLADPTDSVLEDQSLWEDAQRFLQRAFGGELRGTGQALRNAAFRHLILVELSEALGDLPEAAGIQPGPAEADEEQRRRACELLERWRRDIGRIESYRDLAVQAEGDLGLAHSLRWDDRMAGLDTIPALEALAFDQVLELLDGGSVDQARELARRRRESFWVRSGVPEAQIWQRRWEAAGALVDLRAEATCRVPPTGRSTDEILQWYVNDGWRVDQAHRRLEVALTELHEFGSMEQAIQAVRSEYEDWLERVLEAFSRAVEQGVLESSLPRQTHIFKEYVERGEGKVAYFWVDGLRYELGQELAASLRAGPWEVDIAAAVATPPTITTVGMAALLPRAERGLSIGLSSKGELEVSVDGVPIRTVQDRVNLVRAARGEVADFLLNELFDYGENQLAERIGAAQLIIVRSQEIDEAFESDHTAAAWRYMAEIRELLNRAIARLSAASVQRFVIAADHGFLILSRPLGPERTIDRPGGQGALRRRCWIGHGGSASDSAVRVPLADFEVSGGLDLVAPRGLALFAVQGSRRFLHGGLSPQELVVPVITIQVTEPASDAAPRITVAIAGDRITTGVFSATLSLSPDLFTKALQVRVIARNRRGEEVAKMVAGEGYDETSGLVRLGPQPTQVVTFRVTAALAKGDRVSLHVYDSETDRLLGESRAARVVSDVGGD